MGNGISRAQYLSLGAFVINVGTQTYGMLTTPNMKDIADANHYAFSPSPWFIAVFFSGQTLLQAYWIRQLFRLNPAGYQPIDNAAIYALGNLCISGWLLFWLFIVARLPPLTAHSSALLYATHFVAKSTAGIGILDFIDNGGVAAQLRAPPSRNIQMLTYIVFPVLAAASGPIFGSTLVFDLLGLYVGQRSVRGAEGWSSRLGWASVAVAVMVGTKGLLSLSQA